MTLFLYPFSKKLRRREKQRFIKSFLRKYFNRPKALPGIPTLELDRLILRPFLYKDATRVQLLAGDESIASGAINLPHPYLDGVAESWINTHENEFKKGNSLILAITKKGSKELIGSI